MDYFKFDLQLFGVDLTLDLTEVAAVLATGTKYCGVKEGVVHWYDTKEEAKLASCDIREYDRYELANRRYGYSSYKHRIWVHEVLSRGGSNGVYLPTVGEIKKGMEYIANNLKSENFRQEWVDWAVKHEGMTPAQVREELIEDYLNPEED